jgi:hypothetical protein
MKITIMHKDASKTSRNHIPSGNKSRSVNSKSLNKSVIRNKDHIIIDEESYYKNQVYLYDEDYSENIRTLYNSR